jgi:hypothetical protein
MTDRITIINDALTATGNNPCAEYDGSEEWRHGEAAYRRSVGFLLSRHRWNFAKMTWPLNATTSNPSERFQYAFSYPIEMLHLECVYVNGQTTTRYELIDGKICLDDAMTVSAQGVRVPNVGQWPLHWIELLTMRIEQSLYEGLNEDHRASKEKAAFVENLLQEVRTTTDQEEPRRAIFRSKLAERRRTGRF